MMNSNMLRAITDKTTVLKKAAGVLLLTCLVALLCACGRPSGNQNTSEPATGADFSLPNHIAMPVVSADAPAIDDSHVSDGYVVMHASSTSRLKAQVMNGEVTYNYDLPTDDTPTVLPLNMGDGTYRFRIMKNVSGNDYVEVESVEVNVQLSSEFAPFVIPNQYCNYTEESACVQKAREIVSDASNQGEAVQMVCEYVVNNIGYDTEKANRLSDTTGYIPNPDETLAEGSGVCFDYASLGGAMLRSLGFPTKVITGYVSPGNLYHAWIMVYVDGSWQTGEFSVNPDSWSRVDLTFAASGSTEFTGDATSYTERYVY